MSGTQPAFFKLWVGSSFMRLPIPATCPTGALQECDPPASRLLHASPLLDEKWDLGFHALIPNLRDLLPWFYCPPQRFIRTYNPVMKFDLKIHHRRSIRIKGYDYSQVGACFGTVVAWQREMLFGEIMDGEMALNLFGQIVSEKWQWLETQYRYIELGA